MSASVTVKENSRTSKLKKLSSAKICTSYAPGSVKSTLGTVQIPVAWSKLTPPANTNSWSTVVRTISTKTSNIPDSSVAVPDTSYTPVAMTDPVAGDVRETSGGLSSKKGSRNKVVEVVETFPAASSASTITSYVSNSKVLPMWLKGTASVQVNTVSSYSASTKLSVSVNSVPFQNRGGEASSACTWTLIRSIGSLSKAYPNMLLRPVERKASLETPTDGGASGSTTKTVSSVDWRFP